MLRLRTCARLIVICWLLAACGSASTAVKSAPTSNPFAHAAAGSDRLDIPTATPQGWNGDIVQRMLVRTNYHRNLAGCAPLKLNDLLNQAAYYHSKDMFDRNYYTHNDPDGKTPGDRITATGYKWVTWAENISIWPLSPEQLVDGFVAEKPPDDAHRRNILNCQLTEIGIGYFHTDRNPQYGYYTQDFAVPKP